MTSQTEKAQTLRRLHQGPALLVLPNAWDAASARLLEQSGFPAIATSSAGVAAVHGYADGEIPPPEMMAAVARIASVVSIPVTADLEDGYVATGELEGFVRDAIATGAVGLNLEDYRRDGTDLVPLDDQLARIRAIRMSSDRLGVPIVINARTDVFLRQVGSPEARESVAVERGNAFLDAGADCVFVPGVASAAAIGRLVRAIRGPINVLGVFGSPPLDELQRLGVRRVSLGSGPSRVALAAFRDLLAQLQTGSPFDGLRTAITYDDVNALMQQRQR
jgi:2-methylisocitrate lyase-like PEP mutase family enzyme